MKLCCWLLLHIFTAKNALATVLLSQDKQKIKDKGKKLDYLIDTLPLFPGGDVALNAFFEQNLRYPPIARKNDIAGTTTLTIIVQEDGQVTNIEILESSHPLLDEEALRLARLFPHFQPASSNGQNIAVQMDLPVRFYLTEPDR